ncbi:MAG: response regulator [Spirochaetes bacterium]|jgi:CheY-like chemotaxis protein|nr:response regulator [Spirochaetota bacterium]NLJ04753.1 response regulator [Exilispira sp.]MBP8991532.1 response regulator [Spirochaetota bacterium]HNV43816.1 response regulator [Exilispira sp.]HOV46313.1 response regulator [Exilispira sp.]
MKTIFIVDDQMYIRKMLQMVLQENGYSTREFASGSEFLAYLQTMPDDDKPFLILLDIMMPEISGFEILEKIKDIEQIADVPILVISARNQKEDVLQALKLGAKDFIVKPPNIDSLIKKIKSYEHD